MITADGGEHGDGEVRQGFDLNVYRGLPRLIDTFILNDNSGVVGRREAA